MDKNLEDKNIEDENKEEELKCPEVVPEEQTGMTEEEREWSAKTPPRPRVPRYVFVTIAVLLLISFGGGSWWYYRKNVLPEKLYMRAEALYEQKQYAHAEELYRRIMSIRPERRDILFNIAGCREEQGDVPGAIKYYEEHVKTAINDSRAMSRLGWLYMKRGNYEQALRWFKEAGKRKKKDPEIWSMAAEAAVKAGQPAEAAEAYEHLSKLTDDPEKIMECGRALLRVKAYEEALGVYARAAEEAAAGDMRAVHGMNAAKAMLGYPTDPKYVIAPGRALGPIVLDAKKEEVKDALGGRSPDTKEFGVVGGKSMMADRPVEIWTYNVGDPNHEFRVIFTAGRVTEIETASPLYQTERGLGLSNFMLAKNADKLKWRREARNSVILCLAKEGGLTFYAYEPTEDGMDAAAKKLRVHHGEVGIDNVDGFSLMRFNGL